MLAAMAAKKALSGELSPAVVRIPEELRARLGRVGDAMSKRALTALPAAVVARAAFERGLDVLEGELGLKRR